VVEMGICCLGNNNTRQPEGLSKDDFPRPTTYTKQRVLSLPQMNDMDDLREMLHTGHQLGYVTLNLKYVVETDGT